MSGKSTWFALVDEIGSTGLIPNDGEDISIINARPSFDPASLNDGLDVSNVLSADTRPSLSSNQIAEYLKDQAAEWSQLYRKQFTLDVDGNEQFHETPMPVRPSGDQNRLERLLQMSEGEVEGVDFYDMLFGGRKKDGAESSESEDDGASENTSETSKRRRTEGSGISRREEQEMSLRNMMLSNGTRQLNSMFTTGLRGPVSKDATPWRQPDFNPIILVSPLSNSPLQIFNVGMFLHNGRYEDPQRKWLNGATGEANREGRHQGITVAPNSFLNSTKYQTAFRKFLVYDDISQLTPEQWPHVCAAIVSDELWQFDGWFPPAAVRDAIGFEGEKDKLTQPSVLFGNICGFLPYFEEDVQSARLKEWRVKPVVLTRRAMKGGGTHIRQASEFWDHLYTFLDTHPRFRHFCLPVAE